MRSSNRFYIVRAAASAVAIALILAACQQRVTLTNPVIIGRSPDERHVAWAQKAADGKAVVAVDGQVRPGEYDEIGAISFSPDNRRIAFSVKEKGKWRMMVDEKPGPEFDEISVIDIAFSPDGARLAHGARIGSKWYVILDGKPVVAGGHDAIHDLSWSPNGRHLAYRALQGGGQAFVKDGVPGPLFDTVKKAVWGPDGNRFAYIAAKGGRKSVVIDGREGPAYDDVNSLIFSFDGRHFAYGARKGGKSLVTADGREGTAYEMSAPIDPVRYAPADDRLGYVARKGDKGWVVVVDGKESAPSAYISSASLALNPGDKSYAFVAASGPNEVTLVTAYGSSPSFDGIAGPVFSRDGKRIAFAAKKGDKLLVFVDGEAGVAVEGGDLSDLSFSPDGRHLMYKASANGLQFIVLDGRKGPAYDRIYKPSFTDRGVEYVADRESDGWMWRGLIPYDPDAAGADKSMETKLGWLPSTESVQAPCAVCDKQKELLKEEGE